MLTDLTAGELVFAKGCTPDGCMPCVVPMVVEHVWPNSLPGMRDVRARMVRLVDGDAEGRDRPDVPLFRFAPLRSAVPVLLNSRDLHKWPGDVYPGQQVPVFMPKE